MVSNDQSWFIMLNNGLMLGSLVVENLLMQTLVVIPSILIKFGLVIFNPISGTIIGDVSACRLHLQSIVLNCPSLG